MKHIRNIPTLPNIWALLLRQFIRQLKFQKLAGKDYVSSAAMFLPQFRKDIDAFWFTFWAMTCAKWSLSVNHTLESGHFLMNCIRKCHLFAFNYPRKVDTSWGTDTWKVRMPNILLQSCDKKAAFLQIFLHFVLQSLSADFTRKIVPFPGHDTQKVANFRGSYPGMSFVLQKMENTYKKKNNNLYKKNLLLGDWYRVI